MQLQEYISANEDNPFADWIKTLNKPAFIRVQKALVKMEAGNFSNVQSVGKGVHEYKIEFGPGYRIYFGNDSETLIILLGGGEKKRQQVDIEEAQRLWDEYKKEKE